MVFSSFVFLFFFLPFVLAGYYGIFRKNRRAQNIFLTLASLMFYAWGEPVFVFVMIGSALVNWLFGSLSERYGDSSKAQHMITLCTVIVNVSILFVFKYLPFLVNTFTHLQMLDIALPIGISFFTFQAMSYVFDIQRGRGRALKNPVDAVLYISFFPQLIAGPIVRYETIAEQLYNRCETFADFVDGTERFMCGFIKKVLIANNIAYLADIAFDTSVPSVLMAWVGAAAYTLQIYYDFSAYSDMAIGLGAMFGFKLSENFDYPYTSKSVSEFWRRWHISLGTWFRDYVYFPLGGSRVETKSRLVFNLFVVWFLTGVWHGANWTFIIWGLMYFVLIAAEKLTGFAKKLGAFGHIYTMFFVMLGWVLFRSESIPCAAAYISALFGFSEKGVYCASDIFWLENNIVFMAAGIIFSLPAAKKLPRAVQTAGIAAGFIISLSYIAKESYDPFIYFNF